MLKVQIGSSKLSLQFAAGLPYFREQISPSTLFQSLGHLMEIRIPLFLKRVFLKIKSIHDKELRTFWYQGLYKIIVKPA